MKRILLLVLLVYGNTPAKAQLARMETDRPDQTESPFLVPARWFQFEMGWNYQLNSSSGGIKAIEYNHPTLLSKYGLNEWLEFRLITTGRTETTRGPQLSKKLSGLEPVEIGAKLKLFEEKGIIPKTSLIFHFGLPRMASKSFRVSKVAPNFRFVMQNTLSDIVGLGYNLGAEWDGESSTPTWIYTFAPGFNIGKRGYGYIEAFGFINKDQSPQHSIDGGLAFYITDNLKLDISSGFALTRNTPPFYIAVGGSFRFNTRR